MREIWSAGAVCSRPFCRQMCPLLVPGLSHCSAVCVSPFMVALATQPLPLCRSPQQGELPASACERRGSGGAHEAAEVRRLSFFFLLASCRRDYLSLLFFLLASWCAVYEIGRPLLTVHLLQCCFTCSPVPLINCSTASQLPPQDIKLPWCCTCVCAPACPCSSKKCNCKKSKQELTAAHVPVPLPAPAATRSAAARSPSASSSTATALLAAASAARSAAARGAPTARTTCEWFVGKKGCLGRKLEVILFLLIELQSARAAAWGASTAKIISASCIFSLLRLLLPSGLGDGKLSSCKCTACRVRCGALNLAPAAPGCREVVKAAREQIASRNPNAFKEKIEVRKGFRERVVCLGEGVPWLPGF